MPSIFFLLYSLQRFMRQYWIRCVHERCLNKKSLHLTIGFFDRWLLSDIIYYNNANERRGWILKKVKKMRSFGTEPFSSYGHILKHLAWVLWDTQIVYDLFTLVYVYDLSECKKYDFNAIVKFLPYHTTLQWS